MNYLIQEMFNHTYTHIHIYTYIYIYISSPTHRTCSNSWPCNYLILCHPLLLLPSDFPRIGVFSNKSVLHIRWPKCWIFSSPRDSQEFSPIPQFKSINSLMLSLLWSNSHIHTWLLKKNIALTRQTFVGKVMSLLFNMVTAAMKLKDAYSLEGKLWTT